MLVREMTPEEQQLGSQTAASRPPQRAGPSRRRQTFRPRRRVPRPPPGSADTSAPTPSPADSSAESQAEPMAQLPAAEIADRGAPMAASPPEEAEPAFSHEPEPRPAPVQSGAQVISGPAIRQAIEQIQKINKDLEWVLLEMEKAVETLEEAEVQKYADERELESLRQAMQQLNRTRESVQRVHQGGGPRPEPRPRHPQRDHRERGERRFQGRPRHEGRPQRPNAERPPVAHEAPPHHEEEHRGEPPQEPEIPV
jgi:hypothetical protein